MYRSSSVGYTNKKRMYMQSIGNRFSKKIKNSCLLNQSCDGKEDKGINWPHDQVLYSTHWEDCKESFSVEHVQP